ncbi:phosphatidate phosphatase APP1 [Microvirga flocculans]|uniref:Phosphatidate phosphatase APP1 n=1 Tax=Microvirga flocculans TaxID=217168 RepID=A0A7W6N9R1_9HYPH|nr:phasin family protein [Microvirga flocculans]MBB4041775.1 phosphatidate phosphatase APP1 [Microvirga flocculans]
MATMPKSSAVSGAVRSTQETALLGDNARNLSKAAEAWFFATTECNREMIGFVSKRLEKDAETFRQMLGCKNFSDASSLHSRWVEETLRDYNTEMSKLMTIYTKSIDRGKHSGD